MHVKSDGPHPDTTVPGYSQEMCLSLTAYWAEFDPSFGIAVTVNGLPAFTFPGADAAR